MNLSLMSQPDTIKQSSKAALSARQSTVGEEPVGGVSLGLHHLQSVTQMPRRCKVAFLIASAVAIVTVAAILAGVLTSKLTPVDEFKRVNDSVCNATSCPPGQFCLVVDPVTDFICVSLVDNTTNATASPTATTNNSSISVDLLATSHFTKLVETFSTAVSLQHLTTSLVNLNSTKSQSNSASSDASHVTASTLFAAGGGTSATMTSQSATQMTSSTRQQRNTTLTSALTSLSIVTSTAAAEGDCTAASISPTAVPDTCQNVSVGAATGGGDTFTDESYLHCGPPSAANVYADNNTVLGLQFRYGMTSQGWAPIRGNVTSLLGHNYVDLPANSMLRVCLWEGPPPVVLNFLLVIQNQGGPITEEGPYGLQGPCPAHAVNQNVSDFAFISGTCNTADGSFASISFHTWC